MPLIARLRSNAGGWAIIRQHKWANIHCHSHPTHHEPKPTFQIAQSRAARQIGAGTLGPPGSSARRCAAQGSSAASADNSKARWMSRKVPTHRTKSPRSRAPPSDPGPLNAHSPGAWGSGLVQHVFRLPARPPAADPSHRAPRAAPPSEKRYSLCITRRRALIIPDGQTNQRASDTGNQFGRREWLGQNFYDAKPFGNYERMGPVEATAS